MNDAHTVELATDDSDKPGKIGLYMYSCYIDGEEYGGEIPARSWTEAERLLHRLKLDRWQILGRVVAYKSSTVCAICSGPIVDDSPDELRPRSTVDPGDLVDTSDIDWPDEL